MTASSTVIAFQAIIHSEASKTSAATLPVQARP